MSIWGHSEVHVEKVPEKRLWKVSTTNGDPAKRALLVEVKWEDAWKDFPYALDYAEAVATCQSHEDTSLTEEEEELVHDFLEGKITRDEYEGRAAEDPAAAGNVLSFSAFQKKRNR